MKVKFKDVELGKTFKYKGGKFFKITRSSAKVLKCRTKDLAFEAPTPVGELTGFNSNTKVKVK